MKWLMIGLGVIALLGVVLSLYVRLAPSDPEVWHQMPEEVTDRDLEGGAMRVVDAGEDGLARLDAIIRETPRTHALAGSVDEGMITYVTRSRVFGFPDYTTVQQAGPQLLIYGRLRFGASDLGVNAERIDLWLKAFAQRGWRAALRGSAPHDGTPTENYDDAGVLTSRTVTTYTADGVAAGGGSFGSEPESSQLWPGTSLGLKYTELLHWKV